MKIYFKDYMTNDGNQLQLMWSHKWGFQGGRVWLSIVRQVANNGNNCRVLIVMMGTMQTNLYHQMKANFWKLIGPKGAITLLGPKQT
jgi:hypothetical protein